MKSIDIGAESVLVEQIRVNGNYFTLPSFIEAELGRHGIKKDSSLSLRSLFGSCEAASQVFHLYRFDLLTRIFFNSKPDLDPLLVSVAARAT